LIIVDTNLLIYVVNASSPFHSKAKSWFEGVLNGNADVGLPEIVLLGFIRIITQARIVPQPTSAKTAIGLVRNWLAQPNVRLLLSTPRSFEMSLELMEAIGVAANLSTDAHTAALAQIHGAKVATVDTDFQRFAQLSIFNPLRPKAQCSKICGLVG
jgi:uncharacterized protein